jgi:hypothetical protein
MTNNMTTTLLNMQIGAQRRMLGWLPEIAARRDARLIVGMALAGSMLAEPAGAAAASVTPGAAATGSNAACSSGGVLNIVKLIDYATKALIAVIGALCLLRFAMAAWTMVSSNKAGRGKKAMNDIMWVGAGVLVALLIFPLRAGLVLIVKTLFPPGTGGGTGDPTACATGASGGTGGLGAGAAPVAGG